VLDEAEVTSEDRAAALLSHATAEASVEAPATSLTHSPLHIASLQFTDVISPVGIQGTICSGMGYPHPGQLTYSNSSDSADRLVLMGVPVKERFRRGKRR
jgi:hypothetical protein